MSTPGTDVHRTREADRGAPLQGEPVVRFLRSPGRVDVTLKDVDALFDRDGPSAYPHAGPGLESTVADFMVDTVRDDGRSPEVQVTVTFQSPALRPDEESGIRAQMSNFFANEAELAVLERRVNRTEAWGSLWFGIPVILVAGLLAGLLTSASSSLGGPGYLTELAYLSVVVVIWVMLWDPIEKLLFDSYFIRLRTRALRKLARAQVAFEYRPSARTQPSD